MTDQPKPEDLMSDYLDHMSAFVGLNIPDHCRPGVLANLQTLNGLARLVLDFPFDAPDLSPPAFEP